MRIATLIAVLALVLAACSGDGSDTPGTSVAAATTVPSSTGATSVDPTEAASTTTAPPVVFTGADGVETAIADTSRVVSLNGDLTEIIFALGLGDSLVAVDITTTFPPEADVLPEVGFGQQLAAEAVLAFSPSLVIGDQQVAPAETITQLRDAGVPVVIVETQTTVDGVADKIMDVATVLDATEAGRELAESVNAAIAEARSLAETADAPRSAAFIYARGPQQLFLFGAGTVTESMIVSANGVDTIAAGGVSGVVPLTPEALAAAAPEVIILPASGVGALGGLEGVSALPGVAETPAGEAGAFLVYDDGLFLNLGPRTGDALLQLVRDLHPDLEG